MMQCITLPPSVLLKYSLAVLNLRWNTPAVIVAAAVVAAVVVTIPKVAAAVLAGAV